MPSALRPPRLPQRPIVVRLLGLALVAASPLALLNAMDMAQSAAHQRAAADAALAARAQEVAGDARHALAAGWRLLEFLQRQPEVRRRDAAACGELMRSLQGLEPAVANAGLVRPDGEVLCTARGAPGAGARLAPGVPWLAQALAADGTVIGPPRIGSVVRYPTVAMARRLTDPKGAVDAVLAVTLDLPRLTAAWSTQTLPEGAVLEVTDRAGRTVSRVPAAEGLAEVVGRPPLLVAPEGANATLAHGPDGQAWRAARAELADDGWRVVVAAPEASVLASARRQLRHGVAVALGTAALSLMVALVLARRLAEPLQGLLDAARDIANGDHGRRAERSRTTVFEPLVQAFNRALDAHAQAEARWRASEAQLRQVQDSVGALVVSVDLDWRVIYCNAALARFAGRPSAQIIGDHFPSGFLPSCGADDLAQAVTALRGGTDTMRREVQVRGAGGRLRRVRWSLAPLRDGEGALTGLVAFGDDVTEERALQSQVSRLSSLYEALSRVNRAVLRHSDEVALCREVCEACTASGQADFASVWRPQGQHLVMTAVAGTGRRYPEDWDGRFDLESPHNAGSLTAEAVRTGEVCFSNDYLNDAGNRPWRALLRQVGVQSAAVVPLAHAGRSEGILVIHVCRPGAFDAPLLRLLREMGDDLAHALNALQQRTEHERARQQALDNERRFRHVFNAAPQPKTLSQHPDGRLLDVNEAYLAATGLTRVDVLGRRPEELQAGLPADDAARLASHMAMTGGRVRGLQGRFVVADGSVRDMLLQAEFIDFGDRPAVLTLYSDITDLKRAERTLRDREQQLAGIVQTTMDAIVSVDRQHRIRIFNEAAGRIFGVDPATAVGQPLSQFIPAALREAHTGHLAQFAETGGTSRRMGALHELSAVHAKGHVFPIEASISRSGEGEALRMTAVLRDISGAREAETARRAQAVAEAANAAKSEFLSHVSHELRTPLNAILGLNRLMQDDHNERLGPAQGQRVRLSEAAGQHLLALIEDLLDFARLEAGRLTVDRMPVDLGEVLEVCAAFCQSEAQRLGITLHLSRPPASACWVWGDARRLRQVFVNLLSNGIKYNGRGGTVRVSLQDDGEQVQVGIVDDGIGMDEQQLKRLFRPYDRLGREGGGVDGVGIGLALTRELLQRMQGRITLYSRPGQGTEVRVTLSSAPQPTASGRPDAPVDDRHEPAGRVLYVEDDEVNRLIVEQFLTRWPGVQLTLAEDGRGAMHAALRDPPDLVMLDMMLPDVNGLDLLVAMRAEPALRHCQFVVASASGAEADRLRAQQAGADGFWPKPLDFKHLTQEFTRRLGRPAQPAAQALPAPDHRPRTMPVE